MRDPLKPLGSIVVVHCGVVDYSYKEFNLIQKSETWDPLIFRHRGSNRVYRFQHKWFPHDSQAQCKTLDMKI